MSELEEILFKNNISLDEVAFVEPNDYALTNSKKKVVATDYTYSCTNLLIYSNRFAFLAHMHPSQTVGKNSKLPEQIEFVQRVIDVFGKLTTEVNVLVCKGISSDENRQLKFHDLSFINKQLLSLEKYCKEKNIPYNRLPDETSKYLIFDSRENELYIDKPKKINHF